MTAGFPLNRLSKRLKTREGTEQLFWVGVIAVHYSDRKKMSRIYANQITIFADSVVHFFPNVPVQLFDFFEISLFVLSVAVLVSVAVFFGGRVGLWGRFEFAQLHDDGVL